MWSVQTLLAPKQLIRLLNRVFRSSFTKCGELNLLRQHKTNNFAELVCSNSLREGFVNQCCRPPQEEMRRLGSVILEAAEATRVPPVEHLLWTEKVLLVEWRRRYPNTPHWSHSRWNYRNCRQMPSQWSATGPLTSDALAEKIHALNGGDGFYFYDAAAQSSMSILSIWTRSISSHAMTREKQLISTAQWPNKNLWIFTRPWSMLKKPAQLFWKRKVFRRLYANWSHGQTRHQNHALWSLWSQLDSVSDDYKGPRDGEFKTPYAVVQLRQTMQLLASTISLASKLTLNGANKSRSFKWFQVWKTRSLWDTVMHHQFLHGFSKSAGTNLPF